MHPCRMGGQLWAPAFIRSLELVDTFLFSTRNKSAGLVISQPMKNATEPSYTVSPKTGLILDKIFNTNFYSLHGAHAINKVRYKVLSISLPFIVQLSTSFEHALGGKFVIKMPLQTLLHNAYKNEISLHASRKSYNWTDVKMISFSISVNGGHKHIA